MNKSSVCEDRQAFHECWTNQRNSEETNVTRSRRRWVGRKGGWKKLGNLGAREGGKSWPNKPHSYFQQVSRSSWRLRAKLLVGKKIFLYFCFLKFADNFLDKEKYPPFIDGFISFLRPSLTSFLFSILTYLFFSFFSCFLTCLRGRKL